MRGDIPAAAFRLLNTLPVRTIEKKEERSYVGNCKRVRINGKAYPSVIEAAEALGCNRDTIRRMLNSGEAEVIT